MKTQTYRDKPCATCGKVFSPNSSRVKYCSEACKWGVSTCEECGKEFIRTGNTTGKYCSPECWYKAPGKKILNERKCEKCGKAFHPDTATQKYCSTDCAHLAARKERPYTHCLTCGKELPFKLSKRTIRYCSRACALSGQSRRGIKRLDFGERRPGPNGYTLVKVNKDYPGAFKSGWMLEHRYIMEQVLGRPVGPNEQIHHKNGDRKDNRPENLELWTVDKKDPAGQRLLDIIKGNITRLSATDRQDLQNWLQDMLAEES